MTGSSDLRRPTFPPGAGLCATCRQARAIVTAKGSRFVLCERSRTDIRFRRYPPIPVITCSGFERAPASA